MQRLFLCVFSILLFVSQAALGAGAPAPARSKLPPIHRTRLIVPPSPRLMSLNNQRQVYGVPEKKPSCQKPPLPPVAKKEEERTNSDSDQGVPSRSIFSPAKPPEPSKESTPHSGTILQTIILLNDNQVQPQQALSPTRPQTPLPPQSNIIIPQIAPPTARDPQASPQGTFLTVSSANKKSVSASVTPPLTPRAKNSKKSQVHPEPNLVTPPSPNKSSATQLSSVTVPAEPKEEECCTFGKIVAYLCCKIHTAEN